MKNNLALIFLGVSLFFSSLIESKNILGAKQLPGRWPTLTGEPIKIMAHRGEKVFMPQHTEGSYTLAALEGADYVEPDLVLTKDGHLVCFHDMTLRLGTNVASFPQFEDKMVANFTGVLDEYGPTVTILNDWFIKDFTLEELKNLNVEQKDIGIRPQYFNQLFKIPTFEEYLNTVHHNAFKMNQSIGIIPELKHSFFHNQIFNSTPKFMENLVLNTLTEYGYPMNVSAIPQCSSAQDGNASIPCGHLILQSFEFNCIKYLSEMTSVDKMMLISPEPFQLSLLTYQGLKDVANYAQYYSSWKELLYVGVLAQLEYHGIEYDKQEIEQMGGFIPPKDITLEAHALGMSVGVYTIYDSREPSNRGCGIGNCEPENKELELYYYFNLGVDGMFSENIIEARELRMKYQYEVINKGTTNDKGNGASLVNKSQSFMGIILVILLGLIIG